MTDDANSILPTEDYEIILIAVGENSYYLFKGDEHLDQLLVADGEHPEPIYCLRFDTVIDVKLVLGDAVSIAQYWSVHPDIVARLRADGKLIETDG
ncbi:hypothetical protein [Pseudooceanicola sp.]|uniref:hypothetical protein n=1 Tax=Pseudooceanicola sp. TaxID=1914328 RepID=UPI0035C70782